ncbi:MAG: YIP1 family protein, partial [Casimicrobiaceae bacterium]
MDCPVCHAANLDAASFCSRCGSRIELAPTAATVAPAARAPAPAPPRAPGMAGPGAQGLAFAGATAGPAPIGETASTAAIDPAALFQRLLRITLQPKAEWPVIAAEPPSLARVVVGCVLPLAAIQSLLTFVHMAVIGVSVPFAGNVRMPVGSSLTSAVMGFVFAFIGLLVFALIVNAWAPFFGGRRHLGEAFKVAAYAGVPAWFGAFFGVLGMLGTLIGLLAGLYAIYVLYLGLPVVMRSARERAVGYTVAVILTGMLLGLVIGGLFAAVGFGTHGFGHSSAEARAEEGAAMTGSVIGGLLGTDDKGKAALGAAIGNLARAGAQMDKDQHANAPVATAPTPAEAAARAERDATQAGNALGGLLGTDAQGRSALGAALGNLSRAGQQAEGGGTAPATAGAGAAPGVDPANTGAAVGGLLAALGGALGGSQRVTPIDFRNLAAMLPASLNGLPRGAVEGANKQAMGVHGSSTSATYGTGPGRIHLEIADISGVSGLIGLADSL